MKRKKKGIESADMQPRRRVNESYGSSEMSIGKLAGINNINHMLVPASRMSVTNVNNSANQTEYNPPSKARVTDSTSIGRSLGNLTPIPKNPANNSFSKDGGIIISQGAKIDMNSIQVFDTTEA